MLKYIPHPTNNRNYNFSYARGLFNKSNETLRYIGEHITESKDTVIHSIKIV